MRICFLGSGSFGLPTLEHLRAEHEVVLVVSQPDRPAGRKRVPTPTPIAAYARDHGLEVFTPEDPNAPDARERIRGAGAEALVVIAYGHKLGVALLADAFAINLHASLLPRYRGAAPINRAMMAGDEFTGVSVITLAQTMDAGSVLATRSTRIDPHETAGELHDRLALLGPDAVLDVLEAHARGGLSFAEQDPALATRAPKLSKQEGTTDFAAAAPLIRARVHGLNPWPGCTVIVEGERLKLLRVEEADAGMPTEGADAAEAPVTGDAAPGTASLEAASPEAAAPGTVDAAGLVRCAAGALRLLSVQPAGGRAMTFDAYRRGRRLGPGTRLEPVP